MRRGKAAVAVIALLALTLAACAPSAVPAASPSPSPTPTSTPTPRPTPTPTRDPVATLSLEQQVGQLFIVGTDVEAPSPLTLDAVASRHIGGVFLHGRSVAGVDAAAAVAASFTSLVAPGNVPLWVATDQEGGEVQVLRGVGFDDIPYAIRQADDPPAVLQDNATRWGTQLAAAGITLNLAPVADIVTSHETRFDNPPIGALGRQYGYDLATVAANAGAFANGMRAAGVLPTFKHFPGLGHVSANTDHAAEVYDTTVTADGPDVEVYRALLSQGPALVMLSSAVHTGIDPSAPAAFSPVVVTDTLRGRLGYDGVVMTDDVSAASAMTAFPPADRALRSLKAGVDVILVSADPGVFAEMYDAVLAAARADPAVAERVAESARRVLVAKEGGVSGG